MIRLKTPSTVTTLQKALGSGPSPATFAALGAVGTGSFSASTSSTLSTAGTIATHNTGLMSPSNHCNAASASNGAAVGALGLNTDFVPALPVGLMKTLSGSGARGLMIDVMKTYGVDSFQGRLAAIIQGSTETTFYVLAVYFGSVNIRKTRYALTCGLFADFVGLVGAIGVGYAFYH